MNLATYGDDEMLHQRTSQLTSSNQCLPGPGVEVAVAPSIWNVRRSEQAGDEKRESGPKDSTSLALLALVWMILCRDTRLKY
ncbi:hypothetical protein RRG08_035062 [Elysia crispata]|uniref:Uncharacterized protein n=1 Tax=Elysia crispata TaxID=231223 RepID=A0AAE0ZSB0_9GAST|nr:hypothetical protein RRG08_035062 [Elysia crispata]